MSSWKQAIAYVSCAAVPLAFGLYIMFTRALLSAPTIYTAWPYVTKSTLFNDAFPWFFWTATGFVVISLVLGVYLRSHTRAWQTIFYVYGVFLIAFVLEVLQTIAFIFLIYHIPPSYPIVGGMIAETELWEFYVMQFLLPLYCFLTVSAGLGLYIGRKIRLAD